MTGGERLIGIARRLAGELAEFSQLHDPTTKTTPELTAAFSPNAPLLRVNAGRTKSDESEQRGHMHLCQGVVGAWRNPRAHSLIDDEPVRALMMLETIDALIATTKAATRTRKRRAS